ncbi:transposase [Actinomadura fulvescens]|uniref:transposase n=1 Tax=Actinomadura fulvescens TaxID=46160 RepID=UPI0031DCE207
MNVATTAAHVADNDLTSTIHADLAERGLLPDIHLIDSGYTGAEFVVVSRTTPCPGRSRCTRAKREPRQLTLHAREVREALHQARAAQHTEPWKWQYALRSGIEGTISQARPGLPPAQIPLFRVGQDPSATHPDRRGHRPRPHRRLAHRHPLATTRTHRLDRRQAAVAA